MHNQYTNQEIEDLYDKYSSVIYGCIYNMTGNKKTAEKIFTTAFLELIEENFFSNSTHAFYPKLLRALYSFTVKWLKQNGISYTALGTNKQSSLINYFCTECSTVQDAASLLNVNKEYIYKSLRLEFLEIRSQNKVVENKVKIDKKLMPLLHLA